MYLIDSNVISEAMRARPEARVIAWLDRRSGDCALSTIALFEVRLGLCSLPAGRRRDEMMGSLERIIARFGPRIYSFDRPSAEMAAELIGGCAGQGLTLSRGDAQIAGIAGAYGLTVVTRNGKDFEGTGLDIVNPWVD